MKIKVNILFLEILLGLSLFSGFLWADKFISLIDVPTAGILGYGEYNLNFRMYSEGSILSRAVFGVVDRFNFGFYYDVEQVIGSDVAKGRAPEIFIKFRVFHGMGSFPACSIGYDGQGYGQYDDEADKYSEREKGVYLALTKEIFIPGFEYNLGCNLYKFKNATMKDDLYGFVGLSYNVRDKFVFLTEYDNIKKTDENRFNLGVRLFMSPYFSVELSGKGIGRAKDETERILRIDYVGAF